MRQSLPFRGGGGGGWAHESRQRDSGWASAAESLTTWPALGARPFLHQATIAMDEIPPDCGQAGQRYQMAASAGPPTKPRRPGRWLLIMDSFERVFGTTRKNTNLGPCDKTTTLEGASCSLAGRPVGGVAGVWGPLEGVISWLLRQPIRGKTAPPSRPLGTSRGPPNTHPDATCQSLRPPARILQQISPPCACALPSPLPPQRGVVHAEQSRIHASRRPFSQMPPLCRIASSSLFSSIRRRGSGRITPARFVGGNPPSLHGLVEGDCRGKSYLTCRTPQPMTTPWDWPRWTVDCGVKG